VIATSAERDVSVLFGAADDAFHNAKRDGRGRFAIALTR
jgi:hypothetical protein